jgi:hypothetical protein
MHSGRRVASSRSGGCRRRTLQNARIFQGILQYGLLDSGEDESDVRCVGGLCKTEQISGALAAAGRVRTEGIG